MKARRTPPRRAVSLAGLPAVRHEHRGYASLPDAERDRQSKRNFYRIIDRFGWRRDLLVSTLTAAALASRSSWCCQTVNNGSRRPIRNQAIGAASNVTMPVLNMTVRTASVYAAA